LTGSGDTSAVSPNLSKLAAILEVLPVKTYIQQHEGNKTPLCSRMGENTLEHNMRICIEGPEHLFNDTLEAVVDHFKGAKKRRLAL